MSSQQATAGVYRRLAATRGAALPALASLLARLPIAMGSVAVLLYIQRSAASFATAGAVSATVLVGVALGSVVQGRWIDRLGPTRSLATVSAAFTAAAAATFAAVEGGAGLPVLLAVAGLFGATQPATASASRALWGRLVPPGPVRDAALTYEAISLEVFFILGPALAGLLASLPWAGTGLLVAVLSLLLGTAAFVAAPAVRRWRPEATGRPPVRGVWRSPGLRTVLVLVAGFGVVVGFVEVAVPAATTAAGQAATGGLLLGAWSVTSVLFGVVYGARPWPRALALRGPVLLGGFSVMVALVALPPALGAGLAGLGVAMVAAGALITPQSTTHSLLVEAVAAPEAAGEAFGWVITAVTLGLAGGQALSGQVVELAGPPAAVLAGGLCGLALAAVAWRRRRTLR